MRENFPSTKPGDRLTSNHVNRLSNNAERFSRMRTGSYMQGHHTDNFLTVNGLSPWPTMPLIVSNLDIGTIFDSDTLYLVKMRWYDFSVATWKTDDGSEWILDAAESGQTFNVGDKLSGYWYEPRGAFLPVVGGGTYERVRFQIVSADRAASPPSAVVTILSNQCGATSVTEEVSDQITVYDRQGCYIDEPNADLVNRKGWACYMYERSTEACEWQVDGLCCDECP